MIFFLLFLPSYTKAMDFMGASACTKQYAAVGQLDNARFAKYPAAHALNKAIQDEAALGKTSIKLHPKGDKFKLEIVMDFSRSKRKFNALMLRAIKEGSISEIDAGVVVGPKAVSLVRRFEQEFIGNNRDVVIRGGWSAFMIKKQYNSQLSNPGTFSQYLWTAKEKEDFLAASERFGVFDCFKKT